MPAGTMKTHLNSFLLVYIISPNNATAPIEFIISQTFARLGPLATAEEIKRD